MDLVTFVFIAGMIIFALGLWAMICDYLDEREDDELDD